MKFELKPNNRFPERAELIEDLKKVARLLNKETLTSTEYSEYGRWHVDTPIRHFGTWNHALFAAGLKVIRRMSVNEIELFDNLKAIWIKKGRQPYSSEIVKPYSLFDLSVYTKKYGSWRKALESFVANVNGELFSDVEKLIDVNDSNQLSLDKRRNVNLRVRFIVMKRDNFKCVKCGRSPATDSNVILHIDHILPWSKGGKTLIDNLQTLCSDCNIGKSDLFE